MAQPTKNAGPSSGGSAGDTLEFLKIMGVDATAASPAPAPARQRRAGLTDDIESAAMSAHAPAGAPAFDVATLSMPPITSRPNDDEPKPVVIKGGPRRVVRADGVDPTGGPVSRQRRFALSSGHALFMRPRRMSRLTAVLIGLASIVAIVAIVCVCWGVAQSSIRSEKQQDLLGTSTYDTVLSLTPANDRGYYTLIYVTSTPTDEESIGTLERAVLYRTDKDVTHALRIDLPVDLSVTSTKYGTQSMAAVLSDPDRGMNAAMQGIVNNLGIRLYECAVMGADEFDALNGVLEGTADASSVNADSLVGHVRSSFTAQQLVDFCGKIGSLGGSSSLSSVEVPFTTGVDAQGGQVEVCTPEQYAQALDAVLYPSPATDEWGNPEGTAYVTDELGNIQFDESGNPIVAE